MLTIDLNCDMGESTTLWNYEINNDFAIMPFISSVNIACGAHAGDTDTMRSIIESALTNHVAIGAHPAYPDRENFGRVDRWTDTMDAKALQEDLAEQLWRLQKIADEFAAPLHHVKPHGALYNRAAKDDRLNEIICQTVSQFNPTLLLYGLSGSATAGMAATHQLTYVHEVFADRTYQDDGSLTPRTKTNALIESESASLAQVLQMVQTGNVNSINGLSIKVKVQTVCIHSDGKHALLFSKKINQTFKDNLIVLAAPQKKSIH